MLYIVYKTQSNTKIFNTNTFYYNSDYVGVNTTVNSTSEAQLFLVDVNGDEIADGKTYNLTETIYVEARVVNNTDKFVSVVSSYTSETFA